MQQNPTQPAPVHAPAPEPTPAQRKTEAFRRIAAELDRSGQAYCVLHGWEMLGRDQVTDIDLAVSPGALPALAGAIELNGWRIVQVVPYEVGAYFFVAASESDEQRDFLCIDAITDFRSEGRLYIKGSDLLAGRHPDRGFAVASPEAEFTYLLAKKILKGSIPACQRIRLSDLASALGNRADQAAQRLFGAEWATRLSGWIRREAWEELEFNIPALRRALGRTSIRRHFASFILHLPADTRRLVGRVLWPTGFMVVLLGPDGSGKTTLTTNLQLGLAPTYGAFRYFHLRPDLLRRNTISVNSNPHARPCMGIFASLVKLLYLLFDHIVGYQLLVRPRLVRSDLVLFDRYYTDVGIDPRRFRVGAPVWAIKLLGHFAPHPDLFIVLDAPESLIHSRKPELSNDELRALRSGYRALAASLDNAVLLDASEDPVRVTQAASAEICARLHRRQLMRYRPWFGAASSAAANGNGERWLDEPTGWRGAGDQTHPMWRQVRARRQSACEPRRALILDRRAGTVAMQLCRLLAHRGYTVDIFAERHSGAFRSRFCTRALPAPPWDSGEVAGALGALVGGSDYDAIYFCSEAVLVVLLEIVRDAHWKGLVLPDADSLATLISKNATRERMARMGVTVPRTIVPCSEAEAADALDELRPPLYVKGERGESSKNVRLVTRKEDLLPAYREIARCEEIYGGRPVLQEKIVGQSFSVAGLFHQGHPLRICAHRKLLSYPPAGGWTVKGITERPDGLLEEAFKVFAAVNHSGLGHTELIRDNRDGAYKFIELNPRAWGSIGILGSAGVDFVDAYQMLADGLEVEPDLHYREGVLYHRFSGELRLIFKRPLRLPGFVWDALDPRVHSDFSWSDLGPHIPGLRCLRHGRSTNTPLARENAEPTSAGVTLS